jgi:hypothetical protein
MRLFAIAMLGLTVGVPLPASIIGFTFSGTWGGNLGLIQTGAPFSGGLTWDNTTSTNVCPGSMTFSICRPLLSFSYTMPAATGLTVPSIPNPQILFEAALYGTGGVFDAIQVNEQSSVDSNVYIFLLYFGGPGTNLQESNAAFTQSIFPSTLTTTPIPEPGTGFAAGTLALMAMMARRARRSRYDAQ